jgi:hypothetical protein
MMYAVAAIALLVIWAAAAVLALLVTGKRPRLLGAAAGHGTAAVVLIVGFFVQKVVDLASGGSGLRVAAALWTNANSGVPQWVVVQLVLVSMLAGLAVIVGAALTREAHRVPRIDGGLRRWGAIAGALGLAVAFYAWWGLPTPQAGQPVQPVPSARDFSDALAWLPIAMGAFLVRILAGDAPESPAPLDVAGIPASS